MARTLMRKLGMILCGLLVVSPALLFFVWMLSLSLKFEIDNGAYPPILIPDRIAWKNYAGVFESNNFLLY
ncbi:carbohydrate ABC transporter permease, partial [Roseomonas sp. DSM 102946]|nr:carbohydrate ABC transporter permease [Roseomonas sp. DSM 102946]